MDQKKAVLVVSFGTSHLDTLEKNIAAIEQEIGRALPDFALRRAFTSGMIMKKLKQRDGVEIDNVSQALARLLQEGYTHVLIQPTHVINGEEFDKLRRQAEPFEKELSISMGTPLLTTVQDYKDTINAIMAEIAPPEEDEAIVFMGHGTVHYANATYALLEYMFHDFGWDRVLIGTVEGYPELEQVICRLHQMPQVRKVRLHPLMVVAGDHAKNDMAGEEDSWRTQLVEEGYEVSCVLRGFGEYERIRKLFAQHAQNTLEF